MSANHTRRSENALVFAGSSCVLLASLALAGWFFDLPALARIGSTRTPMVPNTAVGLLVDGLGLLCIARERFRPAVGTAACSVALGVLTLAEYISSVDLHIDQVLISAYFGPPTATPGRMAPAAAGAFVLCGPALAWAATIGRRGRGAALIGALGAVIMAFGATSVLGYLVGLKTYGWGPWTPMAANTGLGFTALGSGILVLALNSGGRDDDGYRTWIALPIGSGGITATLLISAALSSELHAQLERLVEMARPFRIDAPDVRRR